MFEVVSIIITSLKVSYRDLCDGDIQNNEINFLLIGSKRGLTIHKESFSFQFNNFFAEMHIQHCIDPVCTKDDQDNHA